MQGVFNVRLLDDGGIPDAVWREACRAKACRELLEGRETVAEARSENLVFDNFAAYLFRYLMSGGGISNPYNLDSGNAWLGHINLLNTDVDPTYQEASDIFTSPGFMTGTVTSDAFKRFIEDDIDTPELTVDPNGREAVIHRSQYLWTPLQAVSTDIRAIGTFFSRDADNTGNTSRGRASRTRLKDSKGRNVRLSKSNRQVIVVEYEFTIVAI